MAKIGIYYGSSTGNTKEVAETIAKQLGVSKADLHDVASADADYSAYDAVLFGSSTHFYGDLQDDWESYIEKVKEASLSGKTVALFGCGDSSSYSETFGNAVGTIYNVIKDKGAKIIGQVSTEGYDFDTSESVVDGKFVGLLIDVDNESDLTDERISNWVAELKEAI